MKKLLITLVLCCAQFIQAETINVADHGVVPGKDASYALNQLIASLKDKDGVTLSFPEGQYEFYPENAIERFRAVSNHDNSLKRIACPLYGLKNITIDGNGSLFMFHGRISPFVLEGTEGATLKNFSIDWSRSFHDEWHIVENDEKSFTVEIDPEKYPYTIKDGNIFSDKYNWQDRLGSNIIFDPETSAPVYNTKDYTLNFSKPYKAKHAGKNRVQIEASTRKKQPLVGGVLVTYGTHPTSRLCPAIHISNARDTKVENVTIYDAGGMGVIVDRSDNIHLDKVKVTSTEDRFVACRADATHFVGCKGTILVENCLFEHMLDDAINVHGAYIKIVENLGEKKFICEISHFQQWGLTFAEPGDKVALVSRETLLPFFETTVTDATIINEHRVVVTVADLPAELPSGPLSMENLTWYPDVNFRNNTIRENRARGMLISSKGKVVIEDNYISSQMHGILIEGDNNKWYESGAVKDITIRNNTFVNAGFGGYDNYPLYAAPLLTKEQRYGDGHYHRNINFVNNTLKSFNGHIVYGFSVKGLTIADNTIEFTDVTYPKLDKYSSIHLKYCDDVTIKGNRSVGFDRVLKIESSEATVEAEGNEGF